MHKQALQTAKTEFTILSVRSKSQARLTKTSLIKDSSESLKSTRNPNPGDMDLARTGDLFITKVVKNNTPNFGRGPRRPQGPTIEYKTHKPSLVTAPESKQKIYSLSIYSKDLGQHVFSTMLNQSEPVLTEGENWHKCLFNRRQKKVILRCRHFHLGVSDPVNPRRLEEVSYRGREIDMEDFEDNKNQKFLFDDLVEFEGFYVKESITSDYLAGDQRSLIAPGSNIVSSFVRNYNLRKIYVARFRAKINSNQLKLASMTKTSVNTLIFRLPKQNLSIEFKKSKPLKFRAILPKAPPLTLGGKLIALPTFSYEGIYPDAYTFNQKSQKFDLRVWVSTSSNRRNRRAFNSTKGVRPSSLFTPLPKSACIDLGRGRGDQGVYLYFSRTGSTLNVCRISLEGYSQICIHSQFEKVFLLGYDENGVREGKRDGLRLRMIHFSDLSHFLNREFGGREVGRAELEGLS